MNYTDDRIILIYFTGIDIVVRNGKAGKMPALRVFISRFFVGRASHTTIA